ncbi:hypothetical protein F5X98DRAFT_384959 [Xylaria grammica]|nr:hypothetical protein F5X98DRAFT_384959 [Xylaria grammica]
MPQRRRIDLRQDDIWKKNAATLRRLYLEEHRTLKAVKETMESQHGFPVTPLSTYESKLRDLGLRKKMKKRDWHHVYQHYVNTGNRHTAIYFNDVRIPWEKAWKEIRRSGARESIDCHSTELPVGVVMRSPSPVPRRIASLYEMPVPWGLSDMSLEILSPASVAYRSKFYEIPSNLLRMEMLSNPHKFFTGISTKSGESSFLYRSLSYQGSNEINLSSDVARLSSALYTLANCSFDPYTSYNRSLDAPLNVIINLTPKRVLLNILADDSPAIRAALVTLLIPVGRLDRKDDFVNLVETIWRLHPEWTLPISCLRYAAEFDCVDSCRTLLQMIHWPKGDQSDSTCWQLSRYSEATLAAIFEGHTDCAKILFQNLIEPSATVLQPKDIFANRIFRDFLQSVANGGYPGLTKFRIGIETPTVLPMLDWFFEVGANVDLPAESGFNLDYRQYTPKNWMPTILDDIYFRNPKLFSLLVSHSVKFKTELTRPGIHHSASEGIDSLRLYLLSRPSHTPAEQDMLVDILLVEEFLRPGVSDFEVIRTLLNYSPNFRQLGLNTSAMIYHVIHKAKEKGMHPAVHHIINTLVQSGAAIVAETMERAIESRGTTLLQLLYSHGADFKNRGAFALCKATQIGNYDAVNWLIDVGLDTDATVGDGWTILARGNSATFYDSVRIFDHVPWQGSVGTPPMSFEMMEYLISHKFKLRVEPGDTDTRRLLCLVLGNITPYDLVEARKKAQLILDAEPWVNGQPMAGECPLEALLRSIHMADGGKRSETFLLMKYLLERGVSARNSGVLAYMFRQSIPDKEIRTLLDAGASIDTYCGEHANEFPYTWRRTPIQAAAGAGSLDWVQYLIQKGADVNKPAKGDTGRTALQAACHTEPPFRNIDLIKLLIAAGADVNAPPAPHRGTTAFQGAAKTGDFEVALLLLDNGADINAPPAEAGGYCALDGAVDCRRLDMVQFLLDLRALSHDMGESGYRGAIRIARERGNPAIADLVRQHALKNGKSGEELSADWDYKFPMKRISRDEGGDLEIWNQTSWEDWLQF